MISFLPVTEPFALSITGSKSKPFTLTVEEKTGFIIKGDNAYVIDVNMQRVKGSDILVYGDNFAMEIPTLTFYINNVLYRIETLEEDITWRGLISAGKAPDGISQASDVDNILFYDSLLKINNRDVMKSDKVIEGGAFRYFPAGCSLHLPASVTSLDINAMSRDMIVYVKSGSYAETILNEDGRLIEGLTVIVE
jgi:hypothetical protein